MQKKKKEQLILTKASGLHSRTFWKKGTDLAHRRLRKNESFFVARIIPTTERFVKRCTDILAISVSAEVAFFMS